jgi:hypothetical protein
MNSGEYIFLKTTSFSLLNFKFTQIFLMGQNDFFKNDWIIGECDRIIDECGRISFFHKITVPFTHQTRFNRILANFTEFFKNQRDRSPPNFFALHKFSNTAWTSSHERMTRYYTFLKAKPPTPSTVISYQKWNLGGQAKQVGKQMQTRPSSDC